MVLELPEKFQLYPRQQEAVDEIVSWFREGKKVIFLDAPTGSGKTVIGDATRIALGVVGGLYVASTKGLQDQFLRDFPYAEVLKGRANYRTQRGPWPEVNCGDCNGTKETGKKDCNWCDSGRECPYEQAKVAAHRAEVAVLNTSYWLTECNYVGTFSGNKFTVIDEAHLLQRTLLGFVQWEVSRRVLDAVGLEAPKKGARSTTIAEWIEGELAPALQSEIQSTPRFDVRGIRRANALQGVLDRCGEMAKEVTRDTWVRDNGSGPLVLKPTDSSEWGGLVWNHSEKFLLMSATIISAKSVAQSLGLAREDWELVRMPMSFPKENRPIYIFPVADMSKKGKEKGEWDRMIPWVADILGIYESSRVLIHTVSYELATKLASYLRQRLTRDVITYTKPEEKNAALKKYMETPASVMVACSMDHGVDLAGDLCEVQIVAKVPFPNLGDVQVSAMAHQRGGQEWYATETVRTLVQMTGRGVRGQEDTCDTYILDTQFGGNIWRKNKDLFPEWWREAVVRDFAVPEFKRLLTELRDEE